jgi:CubicO group peptidase (beta-lactamase class C family)
LFVSSNVTLTFAVLPGANRALLTWGAVHDGNGSPVPASVFPHKRAHSPSSNLNSNALDMARWAIASRNRGEIEGRRILGAGTYDVMWRPVITAEGKTAEAAVSVGIGWSVTQEHGCLMVGLRLAIAGSENKTLIAWS